VLGGIAVTIAAVTPRPQWPSSASSRRMRCSIWSLHCR
jgi:hypothetical protein